MLCRIWIESVRLCQDIWFVLANRFDDKKLVSWFRKEIVGFLKAGFLTKPKFCIERCLIFKHFLINNDFPCLHQLLHFFTFLLHNFLSFLFNPPQPTSFHIIIIFPIISSHKLVIIQSFLQRLIRMFFLIPRFRTNR